MKKAGLILSIISLVTVFFHYDIAVLIISIARIAFGIDNIKHGSILQRVLYYLSAYV